MQQRAGRNGEQDQRGPRVLLYVQAVGADGRPGEVVDLMCDAAMAVGVTAPCAVTCAVSVFGGKREAGSLYVRADSVTVIAAKK